MTPRIDQIQKDIDEQQVERDYRNRQITFIKSLSALYKKLGMQDAFVLNKNGMQMNVLEYYEQILIRELEEFNSSCFKYHNAEVTRIVDTLKPETSKDDSAEEKKIPEEQEKQTAPQIKLVDKRFERLFFLKQIIDQYKKLSKEPPIHPERKISVLKYLFKRECRLVNPVLLPKSASSSSSSTAEVSSNLTTAPLQPKFS